MTAVSFGPIWIAGAVWLLANGAMTSFVTFAPDHYLDLGFGTGSRGFFASLPMWGAALVGPLVGHWTDRHGGKRAFITVGMILMALFLALVPGGVLTPLLIGLGLALALACVPTPLLSLPADLLPPSHHGRAFGILSACANAGIFLIPPLAGTVRDASGAYLWPFMLMSLVAMLGVGVSLRLPSRDNRQWGATDRPG